METLLSRITLNPEVNHGKPGIRNTRHSVEAIMEYLAGGDSVDDVIQELKDLEKDDILACLAYATASIKHKDNKILAEPNRVRVFD